MPELSEEELTDLLAEVVVALRVAREELVALAESGAALPEDITKKLAERDALALTLKAAPAGALPALRAIYKEELAKVSVEGIIGVAVLSDVTDQVDAAWESLARARRRDRGLDLALEDFVIIGGKARE